MGSLEQGLSTEKHKMAAAKELLNWRESGVKGRRRGKNQRHWTAYWTVIGKFY